MATKNKPLYHAHFPKIHMKTETINPELLTSEILSFSLAFIEIASWKTLEKRKTRKITDPPVIYRSAGFRQFSDATMKS